MSFRERQKGVAVVEFAVLFLLLLLILAGVVEFGFLWLQSHYLANAAREGARVAARSDDNTKVEAAVKEYLSDIYGTRVDNCCEKNDFLEIKVEPLSIQPPADKKDGYKVTLTVKAIRIFSGKDGLLSFLSPDSSGTMTHSAFFACESSICETK